MPLRHHSRISFIPLLSFRDGIKGDGESDAIKALLEDFLLHLFLSSARQCGEGGGGLDHQDGIRIFFMSCIDLLGLDTEYELNQIKILWLGLDIEPW
jgi:hypothetical protein